MPSPQRLEQLRRQRALVQEHLAWLDREIAGEMTASRPATPSTPVPSGYRAPLPSATPLSAPVPASLAPAAQVAAGSSTGVNVDELFDRLRADDHKENAPPSKTGCWIAFAVIMLVLIGAAAAAIVFLYR